ncbi:MAG: Permease of the drug/metabolite transporter superfamily [Labilithrix sp.]|nr:Permease of the drug/metabolite transporter superfamily [Labilithrix sp.]
MNDRSAAELVPGKSSRSGGAWGTHAALVLVQFAFASQAVEAKVAMLPRAAGGEEIFPESLAMIRMLGGALFFQAIVTARRARGAPIARADHLRLAGLSILGIALNQTLFLLGLRWTTPFSVSLLGATIPVFAAALAVLFRKESFSWRTLMGLVLAMSGVLSLIGVGSLDRGAILVALNSLSYAAYVVLSRDVVVRVGPLRSITWIFTYAALLFAPVGMRPMLAQLPALTPRGWGFALYILAMPTIVAYLLNAWALGRSSATLVTIYIYLQPLIAAVLAWAQLGMGIANRAWLAAVLILAGLGIVASRDRRPEIDAKAPRRQGAMR